MSHNSKPKLLFDSNALKDLLASNNSKRVGGTLASSDIIQMVLKEETGEFRAKKKKIQQKPKKSKKKVARARIGLVGGLDAVRARKMMLNNIFEYGTVFRVPRECVDYLNRQFKIVQNIAESQLSKLVLGFEQFGGPNTNRVLLDEALILIEFAKIEVNFDWSQRFVRIFHLNDSESITQEIDIASLIAFFRAYIRIRSMALCLGELYGFGRNNNMLLHIDEEGRQNQQEQSLLLDDAIMEVDEEYGSINESRPKNRSKNGRKRKNPLLDGVNNSMIVTNSMIQSQSQPYLGDEDTFLNNTSMTTNQFHNTSMTSFEHSMYTQNIGSTMQQSSQLPPLKFRNPMQGKQSKRKALAKAGFDESFSRATPRVLHYSKNQSSGMAASMNTGGGIGNYTPVDVNALKWELQVAQEGIKHLNKMVDNNIAWVQNNCDLSHISNFSERTKQKCKIMAMERIFHVYVRFSQLTLSWAMQRWKKTCKYLELEVIARRYSKIKGIELFTNTMIEVMFRQFLKGWTPLLSHTRQQIMIEREAATIEIQRVVRGHLGRVKYAKVKLGLIAVVMQNLFRKAKATRVVHQKKVFKTNGAAAKILQKFFRDLVRIRKAQRELLKRKQNKAAIRIQKISRGRQGRKRFLRKLQEVEAKKREEEERAKRAASPDRKKSKDRSRSMFSRNPGQSLKLKAPNFNLFKSPSKDSESEDDSKNTNNNANNNQKAPMSKLKSNKKMETQTMSSKFFGMMSGSTKNKTMINAGTGSRTQSPSQKSRPGSSEQQNRVNSAGPPPVVHNSANNSKPMTPMPPTMEVIEEPIGFTEEDEYTSDKISNMVSEVQSQLQDPARLSPSATARISPMGSARLSPSNTTRLTPGATTPKQSNPSTPPTHELHKELSGDSGSFGVEESTKTSRNEDEKLSESAKLIQKVTRGKIARSRKVKGSSTQGSSKTVRSNASSRASVSSKGYNRSTKSAHGSNASHHDVAITKIQKIARGKLSRKMSAHLALEKQLSSSEMNSSKIDQTTEGSQLDTESLERPSVDNLSTLDQQLEVTNEQDGTTSNIDGDKHLDDKEMSDIFQDEAKVNEDLQNDTNNNNNNNATGLSERPSSVSKKSPFQMFGGFSPFSTKKKDEPQPISSRAVTPADANSNNNTSSNNNVARPATTSPQGFSLLDKITSPLRPNTTTNSSFIKNPFSNWTASMKSGSSSRDTSPERERKFPSFFKSPFGTSSRPQTSNMVEPPSLFESALEEAKSVADESSVGGMEENSQIIDVNHEDDIEDHSLPPAGVGANINSTTVDDNLQSFLDHSESVSVPNVEASGEFSRPVSQAVPSAASQRVKSTSAKKNTGISAKERRGSRDSPPVSAKTKQHDKVETKKSEEHVTKATDDSIGVSSPPASADNTAKTEKDLKKQHDKEEKERIKKEKHDKQEEATKLAKEKAQQKLKDAEAKRKADEEKARAAKHAKEDKEKEIKAKKDKKSSTATTTNKSKDIASPRVIHVEKNELTMASTTKIQQMVRKKISKKRIGRKRDEVKKRQKAVNEMIKWSVVTIQRVARGKIGRKRYARLLNKKREELSKLQNKAAVKIQTRARGMRDRKRVATIKKRLEDEDNEVEWLKSYQRDSGGHLMYEQQDKKVKKSKSKSPSNSATTKAKSKRDLEKDKSEAKLTVKSSKAKSNKKSTKNVKKENSKYISDGEDEDGGDGDVSELESDSMSVSTMNSRPVTRELSSRPGTSSQQQEDRPMTKEKSAKIQSIDETKPLTPEPAENIMSTGQSVKGKSIKKAPSAKNVKEGDRKDPGPPAAAPKVEDSEDEEDDDEEDEVLPQKRGTKPMTQVNDDGTTEELHRVDTTAMNSRSFAKASSSAAQFDTSELDLKIKKLEEIERNIREREEKMLEAERKAEERANAMQRALEAMEKRQKEEDAEKAARQQLMQLAAGPISHRSEYASTGPKNSARNVPPPKNSPFATGGGGRISARGIYSTQPKSARDAPPTARSARGGAGIPPDAYRMTYMGEEWVQLWDPEEASYYWYNERTQFAQWEQPGYEYGVPEGDEQTDSGYESTGAMTDYSTDHGGEYEAESEYSENYAWQEYWDEQAQAKYWYNNATGEASWTKPELDHGQSHKSGVSTAVSSRDMQQALSITASRNGDWISYIDEETQQEYYYNVKTGETSWEKY